MTADDFMSAIEARVKAWFDAQKKTAPTSEARLLLERMCTLISRGGKRTRPQLLYMTYDAYGGKDPDELIDLGLALEFHHQFLLIHDDIIDSDTLRYNGPNIVGYYLKDRSRLKQDISGAMGLLAGDLLFSFANQSIIKSKALTDSHKVTLLEMLNETNKSVIYGQQLDAYNVDPDLSTFTKERMILTHCLKSASYSAQLPMQSAAAILNLGSAEKQKINDFAGAFGILFQLVDDYSDYFTNVSAFNNKPKYRDFRQGKITYPLYVGLKTASPGDLEFLKNNLGNKELPEKSIRRVVTILEGCGAKEASRKYLDGYFQKAHRAVDELSIGDESKQQFIKMVGKYKV